MILPTLTQTFRVVPLAALCFVNSTALARPVEHILSMPTDTVGLHPFMNNPAVYAPKNIVVSFVESKRLNEVTMNTYGNNPRKIVGKTDEHNYALNVTTRLASAVTFGIQGEYSKLTDKSTSDTSNMYANTPAVEELTQRSTTARFAIDLVQNARMGVMFRYTSFNADVIGNFGIQQDDETSYKGTMSSLGGGAWLNSNQLAFAVAYLLPARGKATLLGEDRVVTEPGLVSANVHYELSKEVRFGLGIEKWMYEKDEMSETVQVDENRQVSLNGLNTDRDLYVHETVLFGMDYMMTAVFGLRAGILIQQWEFNTTQADLKSNPNKSNQFQAIRPRLALAILHKDAVVVLGGEYMQRKIDKSSDDRNPFDIKTKDLSFFGSVALNF